MSLKDAFGLLLNLKSRTVTITRPGASPTVATIKISPSNYSRNNQGPSESVITGREFIISKAALDAASFPTPKRGDRIVDSVLGTFVISDIEEMFDIGGAILGFRCRSS